MPQRKIAVLYTGGTIGMQAGADGLQPSAASVLQALQAVSSAADCAVTVCEPLMDSSQVTPQDWCEWLAWIQNVQHDCDGILLLGGTDTLAYSANVLAFAKGSLAVPLVLTGAQQPLGTEQGDAEFNLTTAWAALAQNIAPRGVSIMFDGVLLPAVGSRKISTRSRRGFACKNGSELAHWQNGAWHVLQDAFVPRVRHQKTVMPHADVRIASHYYLPTAQPFALNALLASGADALIVQSFGHGNARLSAAEIAALQAFIEQGGVVVNVSQVFDGEAVRVYAASSALARAGVVFGGNLSVETVYAKLLVGLSAGKRGAALRDYFVENVLGEWDDKSV